MLEEKKSKSQEGTGKNHKILELEKFLGVSYLVVFKLKHKKPMEHFL